MKTAKRLNKIVEYYFSKKLKQVSEMNAKGANIINLGIGNPDQPPPEEVLNELHLTSLLGDANGYQSYRGLLELREAIASWSERVYGISLDAEREILPMMGSKEGIMHISQAFVNPSDEVLIPNPGYPTYRAVSNIVEAEVLSYDVIPNESIDLDQVERRTSKKTKILWLNFPHMPTGQAPNKENLQKLIYLAKEKGFLIVNDNPYSTILTDDYFSIFQLDEAKSVCLELNSLSKSHNMAGWRIGWLSGRRELIDAVLLVKSNMDSGMYKPLQLAAAKALKLDLNWIEELNVIYSERQKHAFQILDSLECECDAHGVGLFVWASIPNRWSSGEELTEFLLHEASVFITPGFVFGSNGERFIRISLCTPIELLKEALGRIQQLKGYSSMSSYQMEKTAERLVEPNITLRNGTKSIEELRESINTVDATILDLLANRMNIAQRIADYKRAANMSILQENRWNDLLENRMDIGRELGLSTEFITRVFEAIHTESIEHQEKVLCSI
ncbi:MAG: aminotransferase class I/II-fold pyridoxal phosphate-dependent enzyme [Crocinitomicaceae bacterium]|nr:aminotransferase class I/II-fold pyridoxal phosphate-dependent enzyme [Crocinitomicaceae bacterium]